MKTSRREGSNQGPTIRPLRRNDFRALKKIERIVVNEYLQFLKETGDRDTIEPWITREYFEYYLRTRSSFVAEAAAEVVGFILSQPTSYVHNSAREIWLEYIAVLPEMRGSRIGSKLMHRIIDRARSKGVAVLYTSLNPNNDASSRFLEKHGFEIKEWKSASKKLEGRKHSVI